MGSEMCIRDSQYPGDMIQFLEAYEEAFMNIEHVTRRKPLNSTSVAPSLYTDDGKRRLFIQNFTVPDLTVELIESVENSPETWDALVDHLHRHLARRTIFAKNIAHRKAHQALTTSPSTQSYTPSNAYASFTGFNISTPEATMEAMHTHAFIYALSVDWNVGF